MQVNLIIECDEILLVIPNVQGEDLPRLIVTLDDVFIEPLMKELVEKLDPETILDCVSDEIIKSYMEASRV